MKITILAIGKRHDPNLADAIFDYTKRLGHYTNIGWHLVDAKVTGSMRPDQIRAVESAVLLQNLDDQDKVILLDETGTQLSSTENAEAIQKHRNKATKHLVFVIGGAYGVSDELKERADFVWSLSKLVLPHQLVRLVLIEQLYRAFTILGGEQYHHK